MFHSSQALAGGDNFMSYISPELDQLIEQARRTMDEPTRMRLWHRAHAVMHEDQPYTFLAFPKSLMFLQNRFHNVQLLILGLNPNEEWFVPSRLQKWTD
jgi:peptide/nickel transport system substrate-binding protein